MSHVTDFPTAVTLEKGAVMDILGVFNDGVEPLASSEVSTVEVQRYRHEEKISGLVTTLDTLGGMDLLTKDQRYWLLQALIVELAFLGGAQYRLDTRAAKTLKEVLSADDSWPIPVLGPDNHVICYEPNPSLPRRDGGYPFEPPPPAEA